MAAGGHVHGTPVQLNLDKLWSHNITLTTRVGKRTEDRRCRGRHGINQTTLAGRMSIVSARFGLAITSESRGDSAIANDLSWIVFFGMIGSRIAYKACWAIREKR
jgi:hypothetical protein